MDLRLHSVEETPSMNRFKCLGNILHMDTKQPRCFARPGGNWRIDQGRRSRTWQKRVKILITEFHAMSPIRLPSSGSRGSEQWLKVKAMVQSHSLAFLHSKSMLLVSEMTPKSEINVLF